MIFKQLGRLVGVNGVTETLSFGIFHPSEQRFRTIYSKNDIFLNARQNGCWNVKPQNFTNFKLELVY